MEPEELERLLEDILYRGISPRRRDLNRSNWSFGQSFLFTLTVVTTIGNTTIETLKYCYSLSVRVRL